MRCCSTPASCRSMPPCSGRSRWSRRDGPRTRPHASRRPCLSRRLRLCARPSSERCSRRKAQRPCPHAPFSLIQRRAPPLIRSRMPRSACGRRGSSATRPPETTGWPETYDLGLSILWPLRQTPPATISPRMLEQTLGGADSFEGRVVKGTVTAHRERPRRHRRRPEVRRPRAAARIRRAGPEGRSQGRRRSRSLCRPRRERAMAKRCCRATAPAAKPPGTSSKPNSPRPARVEGVIFGRVKGGFTVDLERRRGVPARLARSISARSATSPR